MKLVVKEADGVHHVTGNTYPVRERLLAFGFVWDRDARAYVSTSPKAAYKASRLNVPPYHVNRIECDLRLVGKPDEPGREDDIPY